MPVDKAKSIKNRVDTEKRENARKMKPYKIR